MREFTQLLADISGRCAAIFLKAQLYFLGRERARLERLYGERISSFSDDSEVPSPQHVIQLLPPLPAAHRSRDYVA